MLVTRDPFARLRRALRAASGRYEAADGLQGGRRPADSGGDEANEVGEANKVGEERGG